MKRIMLFCAVSAFIFTSCVKNSSEYKALQEKNDSLLLAATKANMEFEQIMGLLGEVEANFQSIKSAENYLTMESSNSGELSPSARDRIQSDIQLITETLDKNRQQIADLEEKLKKSTINTTQLSNNLANLRKELEEKTRSLVTLREELAKRDQQIAELTENVNLLSNDVQALSAESNARQQVIDRQQAELNTAYYCFGTSKELKDMKLLVKGQLGTNFNHNFFVTIDNLNTQKVIPLYAKKGKLISKHPADSYEFINDSDGKVELHILDPKTFWSVTKYLVIEVKV